MLHSGYRTVTPSAGAIVIEVAIAVERIAQLIANDFENRPIDVPKSTYLNDVDTV